MAEHTDEPVAGPPWLHEVTFRVEHSPVCVTRFLVRLCGASTGRIDGLPIGTTLDAYGYGQTLTAAANEARNALALQKELRKKPITDAIRYYRCTLCVNEFVQPPEGYAGLCPGCKKDTANL